MAGLFVYTFTHHHPRSPPLHNTCTYTNSLCGIGLREIRKLVHNNYTTGDNSISLPGKNLRPCCVCCIKSSLSAGASSKLRKIPWYYYIIQHIFIYTNYLYYKTLVQNLVVQLLYAIFNSFSHKHLFSPLCCTFTTCCIMSHQNAAKDFISPALHPRKLQRADEGNTPVPCPVDNLCITCPQTC